MCVSGISAASRCDQIELLRADGREEDRICHAHRHLFLEPARGTHVGFGWRRYSLAWQVRLVTQLRQPVLSRLGAPADSPIRAGLGWLGATKVAQSKRRRINIPEETLAPSTTHRVESREPRAETARAPSLATNTKVRQYPIAPHIPLVLRTRLWGAAYTSRSVKFGSSEIRRSISEV